MSRLISILAAIVLAFCMMAPAMADETVNLVYTNFFPPTHVHSKLAQAWCEAVEKESNGRVKVQYLPGQSLVKAGQGFEAVTGGVVDMAMDCFAYTRGRFPVMEALDLPLGYTSGAMATNVVNQAEAKLKPKELDEVAVMYVHAHGPALLFTKSKPVTDLAGVKGLKVRAQGAGAKVIEALGGTPVAMPMPDAYQALAKGVVDAAMHPIESTAGWKLGEVEKFCTLNYSMAPTTTFFVVMNKDRWQALPEDVKAIITKLNAEFAKKHGEAWDEADQKGQEFFMSRPGRQMLELSPEEAARWKEAVAPVMTDYVERMQKKGLNGKAILETVSEVIAAQPASSGAGS